MTVYPGRRAALWTYPGHDPRTPGRTRFNTGIAYGVWGVGDEVAEALGELAEHLTAHAARVIPCRWYVVTAVLARDRATISVLAPGCSPADGTDPGTRPAVRRLADSWGRLRHTAGPAVYATKVLPPTLRIDHTVGPSHVVEHGAEARSRSTGSTHQVDPPDRSTWSSEPQQQRRESSA